MVCGHVIQKSWGYLKKTLIAVGAHLVVELTSIPSYMFGWNNSTLMHASDKITPQWQVGVVCWFLERSLIYIYLPQLLVIVIHSWLDGWPPHQERSFLLVFPLIVLFCWLQVPTRLITTILLQTNDCWFISQHPRVLMQTVSISSNVCHRYDPLPSGNLT
jgi:hypothetical protein